VDNGLVFATTIGSPIDSQNIINRHFKPLLRHAGLPDIRRHDLRDTYATPYCCLVDELRVCASTCSATLRTS
jgi:hypothetical protein